MQVRQLRKLVDLNVQLGGQTMDDGFETAMGSESEEEDAKALAGRVRGIDKAARQVKKDKGTMAVLERQNFHALRKLAATEDPGHMLQLMEAELLRLDEVKSRQHQRMVEAREALDRTYDRIGVLRELSHKMRGKLPAQSLKANLATKLGDLNRLLETERDDLPKERLSILLTGLEHLQARMAEEEEPGQDGPDPGAHVDDYIEASAPTPKLAQSISSDDDDFDPDTLRRALSDDEGFRQVRYRKRRILSKRPEFHDMSRGDEEGPPSTPKPKKMKEAGSPAGSPSPAPTRSPTGKDLSHLSEARRSSLESCWAARRLKQDRRTSPYAP